MLCHCRRVLYCHQWDCSDLCTEADRMMSAQSHTSQDMRAYVKWISVRKNEQELQWQQDGYITTMVVCHRLWT
jgi:hypothetical protein